MKFHKLRIAWSVTWGMVAVLLCVLWVRSYWNHEAAWFTGTSNIVTGAASQSGAVIIERMLLDFGLSPHGWHYINYGIPDSSPGWFKWKATDAYLLLSVPTWFLSVMSIACGAIPWFPWSKRFSLRTLLIATTLVAVGLGLIVWYSSN